MTDLLPYPRCTFNFFCAESVLINDDFRGQRRKIIGFSSLFSFFCSTFASKITIAGFYNL